MLKLGTDNIGAMYLGTTRVGKCFLGSDLVYNSASDVPAVVEPYIDDGLVLWLDCADATTSVWTDKIGNRTINLYNVTKDNIGGVSFNGSSSYGKYANSINYSRSSCTIEAVIKSVADKEGGIFCDTQGGLSLLFNSAGSVANGASKAYDFSKWNAVIAGLHVITLANNVGYEDGVLLTTNGTASLGGNDTGTYLGRRDVNTNKNGVRSPFEGTIYQVRIYNRLLTQEEIAYNHGVDIRKYGISTS